MKLRSLWFRVFGAAVLSLFLAGVASAQPIYYEIQLDLFEAGELVAAPYVVAEAGKSGSVSFTDDAGRTTTIEILATYEGVVDGQATASLALTVKRRGRGPDSVGAGDAATRDEGPEILMTPTVFVESSEAITDPFTLSQGPLDIVGSLRRVPLSATAAFATANGPADCAATVQGSAGSGQLVTSGGENCCSVGCPDGEGPLQCCDVPQCCCGDAGNCCKPQEKVGF